MTKLLVTMILLSSYAFSINLTVVIPNIQGNKGYMLIGLFNSKSTFKIFGKEFKGTKAKITSSKITYTFKDLPKGTYGVTIIHDENENESIDKNWVGIPQEGYGTSLNARPLARGANWEETKFLLNKNKTINIKLVY